MPEFSIVVPTYNRANVLGTTLSSVLDQTFSDFEILVIDDGSTDNSKAIVDSLNDPRIKYFHIENSGGPATPRNFGMRIARAEWIAFLDSDDLWYPPKLEIVLNSIKKCADVDAISNDELVRDSVSGRTRILRHGPVTEDFYKTLLIEGNRCSTSAMTVRKSFLYKHNLSFDVSSDLVIVEDYDFWMLLASYGARFRFLRSILGEYVLGNSNISGNIIKSRKNLMHMLEKHVFHVQTFEPDRDKLWREIQASTGVSHAVADLRGFRLTSFLLNLFRAIFLSPCGVLRWIRLRFLIRRGMYR
jgi:glycosyltransferase involved in cell wall biosynthesis